MADFSQGSSEPVVFSDVREVNGTETTITAKLAGANLTGANFQSASLAQADLQLANLSDANLRYADLRQSNLSQANLAEADMRSAFLQEANLTQADMTSANLVGANLSLADASGVIFDGTSFVSTLPINFAGDLSYRNFLEMLFSSDCLDGTFLLKLGEAIEASPQNISDNLGRRFYNSGAWRDAVMYICTADLSGVKMRDENPYDLYVPGVDFSDADLRFMNLSRATFSDIIQIEGLPFNLEADLTDITHNEFTNWPAGFTPPPSSVAEPDIP
jgi:uncharacterized protein YjbI with pentapeptide repeats